MKRFVLMVTLLQSVFLCLAPKPVHSQTIWETLWIKSANPTPAYPWMVYLFSGIAYDRVRDKLYVISIKSTGGVPNPEIWILNPATGDTTGKLKIDKNFINSGFSSGMYCLFKIQVANDGNIYACNMVAPSGGNNGNFKVFKWVSPDSMPIMVYPKDNLTSDSLTKFQRWGDAFGVIGKKDSTTIFISGGSILNFNPEFVALQANDTSAKKFHIARKMPSSLNGVASHGIAPTGVSKLKPVWVNSAARVTSLQTQTNPPVSVDDVPQLIDRITSGTVRYFELQDINRKFIVTCDGENADGGDSTRARLIDISIPNSFFLEGEHTPAIGNFELVNTSGDLNNAQDVDYKIVGHRVTLFVLMSNNGIGAFRLTYDITPVELASFRAIPVDDNVELRWLVTQETNNYGFEVQRSFDGGKNFERIGFVSGRGSTNEAKEYLYLDPVKDINVGLSVVYYRLKQIDTDGSSQYSPTVQVLLSTTPTDVVLGQNYPNPFFGSLATTIAYQMTQPGFVTLKIYNSLGEELKTLVSESKDIGTHLVRVDALDFPSGMYYYQLTALGQTVQKKMVMIR